MVNLVDWRSLASGSAQHQLGLFRAWTRSGYEVRMIAPRPPESASLPSDLRAAARFSPSFRRLRLPSSLDTLAQIVELVILRLTWKPDIVFSRVNSLTALLVAACRLMGLRVIIDHNGWLAKERRQAGGSRILAWLEERSQVAAAKWASGSRCVTRGMAEALSERGVSRGRLCAIGNGTDTEEFRPMDRRAALSAFGLSRERDYVGFLGNVVPWHRVDVAISAFARIAAEFPRLDFLIFGDGPSVVDLKQQAKDAGLADRVIFMGRVESDRANEAINCFTLGVVPLTLQRDTAFGYSPVKIRDYAAAGCPVLTGAVPDNLELDGIGWLFTHAPDDASEMAAQLRALFERPERLRAGAELARAYAVANFDWDEIGDRILRQLDPVAFAPKPPDDQRTL
ncbi:MAG: glycosyltransferase family 4 protein [Hyphomicrobiaceae bacterium]